MKKFKKLKVFFSLTLMFCLLSIFNVSAMERKNESFDKRKNVENVENENKSGGGKRSKKRNKRRNQRVEQNNSINLFNETVNKKEELKSVKKLNEYELNEYELKDLSQKFFPESDFLETYDRNSIVYLNKLFEDIVSCLGFYSYFGENSSAIENNKFKGKFYVETSPYKYKIIKSNDGTKKIVPFDSKIIRNVYDEDYFSTHLYEFKGKDVNLFREFEEEKVKLGQFFGASWFAYLCRYYDNCFKENSKFPVEYIGNDGEVKYRIPENILNFCSAYVVKNGKNFDLHFKELIKLFFKEMFLKLLFMSHYRDKYNFENEEIVNLVKVFSKIMSDSLKLDFSELGLLKGFSLDFTEVLKDEENKKFLKNFYYVINRDVKSLSYTTDGNKNKMEVNNLLYDLYTATSAFLKNAEFWKKMFGILIFNDVDYVAEKPDPEYKKINNYVDSYKMYYNIYKTFLKAKTIEKLIKEKKNVSNCDVDFNNENVTEYDFADDYNRLKQFYFALLKDGEKGVYNKYVGDLFKNAFKGVKKIEKKENLKEKNLLKYLNVITNKEKWDDNSKEAMSRFENFNTIDDNIAAKFYSYWVNRFKNSFDFELSINLTKKQIEKRKGLFDYFALGSYEPRYKNPEIEVFDNRFPDLFVKKENSNDFVKIDEDVFKVGDRFIISENVMLECLDRALQYEKIREECLVLIKYMFRHYLILGFIKVYGNKEDQNNVLILRLSKYFDNILDVRFEKNNDGKLRLKLGFKKAYSSNYYTKQLNQDIEKFKDKKNWKYNTTKEQMLYRAYLTARTFIKEENFWNRFLAYLICNKQIKVAENFSSYDSVGVYKTYKKLNKHMLNDEFFSNLKGYSDKMFVDFVTEKIYNTPHQYMNRLRKNIFFVENYYNLRDKEDLKSMFISNIIPFYKNFTKNYVDFYIKINESIGEGLDIAKYANVFGYSNVINFLNDLLLFIKNFKISKAQELENEDDLFKEDPAIYYEYILKDRKISNEIISFVECFFRDYMNRLVKNINGIDVIPDDYSEDLKKVILEKVNPNINLLLEWFSRIFYPHVEDDKIKFDFNFGYYYDEVFPNLDILIEGIKEYGNSSEKVNAKAALEDIKKVLETKNEKRATDEKINAAVVEYLKRLFYNLFLDALGFLNSEDVLNKFFSNRVYNSSELAKKMKLEKNKCSGTLLKTPMYSLVNEFNKASEEMLKGDEIIFYGVEDEPKYKKEKAIEEKKHILNNASEEIVKKEETGEINTMLKDFLKNNKEEENKKTRRKTINVMLEDVIKKYKGKAKEKIENIIKTQDFKDNKDIIEKEYKERGETVNFSNIENFLKAYSEKERNNYLFNKK